MARWKIVSTSASSSGFTFFGYLQGGFQEDLCLEALGLPRDLLRTLHHKTLELASTFGIRPPRSRLFYVGCWNLTVGFTAELEVDISRCN